MKKHSIFRITLLVVIINILFFAVNIYIFAGNDTKAPSLISFDFEPKMVDTSLSSQTITFTIHVTDDLSGLDHGVFDFKSPSGNQHLEGWLSPYNLITGDKLDGVYLETVDLPQNSEAGTWRIDDFILYDETNNQRELDRADLLLAGFPTSFLNGIKKPVLYLPIIYRK